MNRMLQKLKTEIVVEVPPEYVLVKKSEYEELLEEKKSSRVFWDTKELKRQTCMSWNTILDNFFYDERFPKGKIGGKWFYLAEEAEIFLREWFMEHRGETFKVKPYEYT